MIVSLKAFPLCYRNIAMMITRGRRLKYAHCHNINFSSNRNHSHIGYYTPHITLLDITSVIHILIF